MTKKKKILIINEDQYFVKVLSKYLESRNYEIFPFFDSSEGVNSVKSIMPDLIILDYEMPKLDGLSLAKLLRNKPGINHIPIFMFLPILEKEGIEKIVQAGVNDYIIKPFDPKLFFSKIKVFFDQDVLASKPAKEVSKSKTIKVKKAEILIIEDISASNSGLHNILKKDIYSIEIINDIKEGLAYLRQNHVDLIFLDRSINNNMGIEICRAIKRTKQLNSIPVIMITQELDMEIEFQAIAAGASFVFKKPVLHEKQMIMVKIVETLEEYAHKIETSRETKTDILKKRQEEKKLNIDRLLKRVRNLTTTPFIVARINDLVSSPNTALVKLANIIKSDQALTSRILKLVNSSYYGLRRKISNIQSAISYIGFEATKKISQAIAAYEFLSKESTPRLFDRVAFWEHCLSVATHAKQIAKATAYDNPEDAFIAGLLHDVGKSVLSEHARESFVDAFIHATNEKIPLHEAEEKLIGSTHAICGREFLSKWRMPETIIESSSHHHRKTSEIQSSQSITEKPIIFSVKMANTICKAKLMGYSGNSFIEEPLEELVKALYINQYKFERILIEGINELENYKSQVFLNKKKIKKNKLLSDDLHNSRQTENILLISSSPDFNLFALILENAGYNLKKHSFESDMDKLSGNIGKISQLIINFDPQKNDQFFVVMEILNQFEKVHQNKPLIVIGDEDVKKMLKRISRNPFTFFSFPIDPEEFLKTVDESVI